MTYTPRPDATTVERIAALREVLLPTDVDEIAATLVDEDESAYPGSWQAAGFDRGAAISEYLFEIGRVDGTLDIMGNPTEGR
jgi:hypothetical protein